MPGIYTPAPETQSGPSLGGSLLYNTGMMGLDRSAAVRRTMLNGPIENGFFRTFFGFRQTKDEMDAFMNKGPGFFGGENWRNKVWKPLNLPGGRLMGTKFAPSSWMTALDIAEGRGNLGMMNIAGGRRMTDNIVTGATRTMKPMPMRANPNMVAMGANGKPVMQAVDTVEEVSWRTGMKRGEFGYSYTLNKFTGIGKATRGNVVRDYVLGSLFDVDTAGGLSDDFIKATAGSFRDFYTKGSILEKGAIAASKGGSAITGATKTGLALRGTFSALGFASRAYGIYWMTKEGTKALYKTWEAVNIKVPLAAYKAFGSQLMRPAFASGDASLLTGVPANNRMRAVQAIQGSRMNARSAIGGEAALLAGHFG